MTITNNVIEFLDSCNEAPKRFATVTKPIHERSNELFKIYPNPNNGSMVLEYTVNSTDVAVMQLVDITGKEVGTYPMNANTDKLQINNSKLNNGIYFYQIVVNNKIVKHDKLIIIK